MRRHFGSGLIRLIFPPFEPHLDEPPCIVLADQRLGPLAGDMGPVMRLDHGPHVAARFAHLNVYIAVLGLQLGGIWLTSGSILPLSIRRGAPLAYAAR